MVKQFVKKLTSRKFIVSALVSVGGIATALSGVAGNVGVVAGVVSATVSALMYVYTEGKIDEKAVTLTVDAVERILALIRKDDENGD